MVWRAMAAGRRLIAMVAIRTRPRRAWGAARARGLVGRRGLGGRRGDRRDGRDRRRRHGRESRRRLAPQLAAGDGLGEALLVRGPDHALVADDAGDEVGRGHVEGGIADLGVRRGDAHAAHEQDLVRLALLDRDRRTVGRGEVHRADRCHEVERDAVPSRQHGQRVGPDLVGRVAVGGDPVGPDEDDVHLAVRHQVTGGHVRDQRVRNAGLGQLPGGQPRALQVRSGLVDPDVHGPPGVVCGLDDAEGGPELAACQGPGIAMREDPQRPVLRERQFLQAERRQATVILGRLEDDRIRLGAHRVGDGIAVLGQVADRLVRGHDPLDRPAQVDRGRACVDERLRRTTERRAARVRTRGPGLLRRERQPDRPDLADGRCAAHDHLPDREGGLRCRPGAVLLEHVRQLALVDEVEDPGRLAERRPEPGRRGGYGRYGRGPTDRHGARIEDRAGGLRGDALDRLCGADHARRAVEQVTGELPEETPPGQVGALTRRNHGVRFGGSGIGRIGQIAWGLERIVSTG